MSVSQKSNRENYLESRVLKFKGQHQIADKGPFCHSQLVFKTKDRYHNFFLLPVAFLGVVEELYVCIG